jgi:hypothetical protein
MSISKFIQARDRFYNAKNNYISSLNEFREARNAFDSTIEEMNCSLLKEKEMTNAASIFASPKFNFPTAIPQDMITIESVVETPEIQAAVKVLTTPQEPPKQPINIRPAVSYKRKTSEQIPFNRQLSIEERTVWKKQFKNYVEKNMDYVSGRTGIPLGTIRQWFIRENAHPSKPKFDMISNFMKNK